MSNHRILGDNLARSPLETSHLPVPLPSGEPAPEWMPAQRADPDMLPDLGRALSRHKLAVLAIALAALLLAAVFTRLQTPLYRAQLTLEFRDPGASLSPFRTPTAAADPTSETAIQTNVALLEGAPLSRRVVARLRLDQRWASGKSWDPAAVLRRFLGPPPLQEEPPEERALERALQNLVVRHQAGIIEIDYTSEDPVLAADFVNTLADEHLRRNQEVNSDATQHFGQWLLQETDDLQRQLQKSEAEVQSYARGTGLLTTADQNTAGERNLQLAGEELARSQADRIVKQANSEMAASTETEWLPQSLENPAVREYQSKLTDLRREAEQLKSLLTPENYKVQRVVSEIAVEQTALTNELASTRKRLENDYHTALSREKMLAERYSRQSAQVSEQAASSIHYATLKRQLETARVLYAEILEKTQQFHLAAATPSSNLRIVGNAFPPPRPYRPNYLLNLSLGLFGGLLAGVMFAFVKERRRPTLRAPGETPVLLHLPEFAAIPKAPKPRAMTTAHTLGLEVRTNSLALAAWRAQPSLLIESIHDIVASVAGRCDSRSNVVMLTSPGWGEGKTTVAANLAIALVQSQRRVLLIDGDLRRPNLHKIFRAPLGPGLSELLGDESLSDPRIHAAILTPLAMHDLHFLPSGRLSIPSALLLSIGRCSELITRLRSQYDIVLIDTPPVLYGPDALLLGRLADAVILVVRSQKTTYQDAHAAIMRLATDGIPVAGTILNDWNPRSDRAPYGYESYKAYAAADRAGLRRRC